MAVINEYKFKGIDIVFHTAALKHVILSERSPEQFIETNVIGVQNVISAANVNNIEKVKKGGPRIPKWQ